MPTRVGPAPVPSIKPNRLQLRHQARTLDSFGPASELVDVGAFVQDAEPLARAYLEGEPAKGPLLDEGWRKALKKKDQATLKEECSLDDLIASTEELYNNPHLILELRTYQHEVATPFGSLHAINATSFKLEDDDDQQPVYPVPADTATAQHELGAERPKKRPRTSGPAQGETVQGSAKRGKKPKGKAKGDDLLDTNGDIVVGQPALDPSIHPDLQVGPAHGSPDVGSDDEDGLPTPDPEGKPGKQPGKRIRKKRAGPRLPLSEKEEDIRQLVGQMEATGIRMLMSNPESRFYVKAVGRTDFNILAQSKFSTGSPLPARSTPPAIITITFHPLGRLSDVGFDIKPSGSNPPNPLTGDHKAIAPRLQTVHVLSSQTLADLRDAIVCAADMIPIEEESGETDKAGLTRKKCKWKKDKWDGGAAVVLENVLYGDKRGIGEVEGKLDYAKMVADQLSEFLAPRVPGSAARANGDIPTSVGPASPASSSEDPPKFPAFFAFRREPFEVADKGMEDMRFDGLKVKVGEPYWLLHQGSCEHVFTIDEIRCLHPEDPSPFGASSAETSVSTGGRRTKAAAKAPKTASTAPPAVSGSTAEGYPVTTFLGRTGSAKCRVCNSDPASMVVVEDELCGDSPCFCCDKCFELLHGHEDPDGEKEYWVLPFFQEA